MRVSIIAVVALIMLALFTQVLTASPGAPTGIIIRDADSDWESSLAPSTGLVDAARSVTRRVVVQYAKSVFLHVPVEMPAALQDRVNAVLPRVPVQYANSLYLRSTTPIPDNLQDPVELVAPRVWLDHANANRNYALLYPQELFNDTVSPTITGVALTSNRGYSAVIAWSTNEYADSQVHYGLQSGQYPYTVQDPLYLKQHQVTLRGLTPGTAYYFLVRSSDRSGNAAESAESRFTTIFPTYLPVILRRR